MGCGWPETTRNPERCQDTTFRNQKPQPTFIHTVFEVDDALAQKLSDATGAPLAAGRLKPGRELVFPPAGGTKGVKALSGILGGRNEALPVALFDSDSAGRETIKSLRQTLYAGDPDLVLEVGPFAGGIADAEIEDILPAGIIIKQLGKWLRTVDVLFAEEYKPGAAIVPQIEA